MTRQRDKKGRFMRQPEQLLRIKEVGGAEGTGISPGTGLRREVTLITAGWGSSGYYSKEMLARDGAKAFPRGTHMYMNHPTTTEEIERPERSVQDLAAVLLTDPEMRGNDLVAEAGIKEHWAPVINAVAKDIGTSIRAIGEAEHGDAEGRHGPIITALTEGISVDFVTHAGAGGKIGMLLESARAVGAEVEEARNAADYYAARMHSHFTVMADEMYAEGNLTRDERIALSAAVGDALDSFNAAIDDNLPQLKNRDPYSVPEDTGVVEEGRRSDGKTQQEEAKMADEERLSELEESVRQHETQITELTESRDSEKERADRAEDALVMEKARNIVNEALEAEVEEGEDALPQLPDRARERVREAALKGKLPLDEDGKLDKGKLVERVHKAVRDEAEYLGSTSEAGTVQGMGAGTPVAETAAGAGNGNGGGEPLADADKERLVESFKRAGMSEEAAKIAAEGR